MTYVPDAKVYTVEVIDGPGMKRVIANLRRWSGNMLRNGARAIALGPRQVGPFIWWCVVDQRIAMWTMLVGPVISILAAFIDPSFLVTLMLWVVLSRIVLSIWLFRFADKVDWTWPIILYVNQVVNAAVKVRLIYFLNRQTWANRGNQQAGEARGWWGKAKNAVAWSQLFIAITLFVWIIWEMSNFIAAAMNPA
jgi:glycosyltransferase Alg8